MKEIRPGPGPAISVVIPCFNAGAYLRETIESVLAQTYSPLEVLLVDDGSTDDSAEIAESFGHPVRVIRQRNQGESVARNRGLDEAQGDWVAFLDADDVWKPTKLEKQAPLAVPGVACVHTNFFFFGAESGEVDVSVIPPARRYALTQISQAVTVNTSTILVRRELPTRFPVWTRFAEDMVYYLDLVQRGPFRLVAEPLVGYRRHGRSQTANPRRDVECHRTILAWLQANRALVGRRRAEEIQIGWLERLVETALSAAEQGQKDRAACIREHLAAYRAYPLVRWFLENAPWFRLSLSMRRGWRRISAAVGDRWSRRRQAG